MTLTNGRFLNGHYSLAVRVADTYYYCCVFVAFTFLPFFVDEFDNDRTETQE